MNGSIGILNVNNRMRILFGNEFGLNIYSKRGKGTLVKMKLPIQSKDNISNSKS
jgi:sensor histidine kinase YesM